MHVEMGERRMVLMGLDDTRVPVTKTGTTARVTLGRVSTSVVNTRATIKGVEPWRRVVSGSLTRRTHLGHMVMVLLLLMLSVR